MRTQESFLSVSNAKTNYILFLRIQIFRIKSMVIHIKVEDKLKHFNNSHSFMSTQIYE